MTPADITFQQLGGSRFVAMTGARGFCTDSRAGSRSLTFSLPRPAKWNAVRIELNDADLYDVHFYDMRRTNIVAVKDVENVDAENLRHVFECATGLRTSL